MASVETEPDLLTPTPVTGHLIGYARTSRRHQNLDRGRLQTHLPRPALRQGRRPSRTDRGSRLSARGRHPRSHRAVPTRPLPAGPDHHRHRPASPPSRVPVLARTARHHHPGWTPGLPRLRRPGRIHPGAHRGRTHEGLDAARARGQKLGRPTVMTPEKIRMAAELVGKESVAAIARLLGVNRATVYAHVPELQNRHRTALPRAQAHRNDQSR